MTEPTTTPRRGRRARALSPEESAALESRSAVAITAEQSPVPGVRGAVAPPGADSPVPTLRKFGRRARIIELSDDPEATSILTPIPDEPPAPAPATSSAGSPASSPSLSPSSPARPASSPSAPASTQSAQAEASRPPAAPAPAIDRDHDGVELGELSVTEAPSPRPAPRFDGKVLHRPENAGSRPLMWLVWGLIAIALIVLVVLLLTGVLGTGEASALDASMHDLFDIRTVLEEPAA